MFNREVSYALVAAGAQPGAVEYLHGEARKVFEVRDGVVKARVGQFSRSRPDEPITVEEWLASETRTHAFAFVVSREH